MNNSQIRVTPSPAAPNYAPAHIAEDLGFFRARGLDVTSDVYAGPGSSWLADNVLAGKAEVALGGVWIPLAYRSGIAHLRAFAMVCARNPQVFVGRHAEQLTDWTSVYGKRVLLPMSSTSQWLFLEGALMERGVDTGRIHWVRDLDEATITRLWRAGLGDYYLVTPPLAEQLEDEGFPVVTTMAEVGGEVPWSVYYTTAETLESDDGSLAAFVGGLQDALDFIHASTDDEVAVALAPRFPAVPTPVMVRAVTRLRASGVWATTTEVPRAAYERYEKMIAEFGLIYEMPAFDDMVEVLRS